MTEKVYVDLIAQTYRWDCTKCNHSNLEDNIPINGAVLETVKCIKCKAIYDINYYHNFSSKVKNHEK